MNPVGLNSLLVQKKIALRSQDPAGAQLIAEEYKLAPLTARILASRNFLIDHKLETYLKPTLQKGLIEPDKLKNLAEGAALIASHVKNKNKIAICCDFDVDGLSGGSQIFHFLRSIGTRCKVFVPDRFRDGYGLNQEIIEKIKEQDFSLIITVDFGSSNHTELALANSLGIKSVVIDHHAVQSNPPCTVFINPQQVGCGFADGIMSASGLAWYMLLALKKELPEAADINIKNYLDLACLGTICDMVPLAGINRIIAKRGLELMARTSRPGIVALKEVTGVLGEVSCTHVSFGFGPRINAAGRILHGDLVIDLLTTSDISKARRTARKLHKLNKERQEVEETIKHVALNTVQALQELPSGIVVANKDFHTGVIGIVAQRMVEAFYRPAAVLGQENGVYKGSVRGIKGFSVVEVLEKLSSLLEKHGGHAGAGGFSLKPENLEEFKLAFEKECAERIADLELSPLAEADTEASLSELTPQIISELKCFEPLGMGNPGPLVLFDNLKVQDIRLIKDAHLKLRLTDGKSTITAMMWRTTSHPNLEVMRKIRVVGKPGINEYQGKVEPQIIVQAIEGIS